MSQRKFLFDTDCLITAKNTYYSPEFSVAFWDWLIAGNKQGVFFMVDKVIDELKQGHEDDYLYKFADTHGDNFKLATSAHDCLQKYGELQNWASATWATGKKPSDTNKALTVFANVDMADPWQIAFANIHGFDIVTNEVPAPDSKTIIKLPDAAKAFNVKVIKLHEVLSLYSGQNFTFKFPTP
ncbi:MAG: DUF4411 family protein [Methylophilaceae bacterium]